MKRWQSLALGILISGVALVYSLRGIQFEQFRDELTHANYMWVLPCLVLMGLGLFLRAVRWRALLNGRLPLGNGFNILNASYLFNTLLPFRLGEVVRAYMVTRIPQPIEMLTSLSSIVVERLIDLLAVVVIVIVALLIKPITPEVASAAQLSAIVAVTGVIVLAVFAARRDWAHRILELMLRVLPFLKRFNLTTLMDHALDGIAPLGSVQRASVAVGWTVVAWAASALQTYVLLFAFFDQPQFNAGLLAVSLASLAVALPVAPSGVGAFEAAILVALQVSGMVSGSPAEQARALAYAVVLHVLSAILYAVLGLYGLSREQISLGAVLRSAQQMAANLRHSEGSAS